MEDVSSKKKKKKISNGEIKHGKEFSSVIARKPVKTKSASDEAERKASDNEDGGGGGGGFSCSSGFSFNDILSLNDSKSSPANKKSKRQNRKMDQQNPSRISDQSLSSSSSTSEKDAKALDWSKILPKTDPDYRPPQRRLLSDAMYEPIPKQKRSRGNAEFSDSPLPLRLLFQKSNAVILTTLIAESQLDPSLFTSKSSRSKVFAGRRTVTYTSVPTLFDVCMRVICDNIDGKFPTAGPYQGAGAVHTGTGENMIRTTSLGKQNSVSSKRIETG